MWRGVFIAVMLVLALAPAATAQDDDAEPAPTPAPVTGCERGPGTDADYADCEPDRRCDEASTDADYVYGCCDDLDGTDADYVYACEVQGSPTADDPSPRPPPRPAVQALGAQPTLPMTGNEPLGVALAGAGMLLAGAGLRLRTRRVVP